MPNLPTLSPTQAQVDRIIAAYARGGSQADAIANYKEWLRRQIVKYVQDEEMRLFRVQQMDDLALKEKEITDAMPAPPPPPPPPPEIPVGP